jgi:2-oxoglutarate ferredoxin oxidoreductase subunit alpha
MVDLIQQSFDVAEVYRNPVMVMGDGMLGQMMEPVEFKEVEKREIPSKDTWAANGLHGREKHHVINSLYLKPEELEDLNIRLQKKYAVIKEKEARYETFNCEGEMDMVIVAYGTVSRICKNAIKMLEKDGIKVGLIRPITLWPFPVKAFEEVIDRTKNGFISVELSCGQMVEDVELASKGRKPVHFYGRTGGMVPTPTEIANKIKSLVGGAR